MPARQRIPASACALLAVIGVALTACGGAEDESEQSTAATPPAPAAPTTPARPTARVEAICARLSEGMKDLDREARAKAGQRLDELEPTFRRAVAVHDDAIERFRALAPRMDDRAFVRRYLDAVEEQRVTLDEIADAAARVDAAGFRDGAARLNELSKRRRALAEAYGVKKCAAE